MSIVADFRKYSEVIKKPPKPSVVGECVGPNKTTLNCTPGFPLSQLINALAVNHP